MDRQTKGELVIVMLLTALIVPGLVSATLALRSFKCMALMQRAK